MPDRYFVRVVTGFTRPIREPNLVIDRTTNEVVDAYKSKRAANSHARDLNTREEGSAMAATTWGKQPFHSIEVHLSKEAAQAAVRAINERSRDREARWFARAVRAGRAAAVVYVVVTRGREV